MALSTAEKRKIKKHLGYLPQTDVLDSNFEEIDLDSSWLSDTQAQITTCDTRLTNYETAVGNADEVKSGMGASLDHNIPINKKKLLYKQAVDELSRLVGFPVLRYIVDDSGENASLGGFIGGY